MRDAVLFHLAQGEQFLARGDLALDDPKERAAIQNLFRAPGRLAGDMDQLWLLALGALVFQALLLPCGQIGDAFATDAELDDVERPGRQLMPPGRNYNRNIPWRTRRLPILNRHRARIGPCANFCM